MDVRKVFGIPKFSSSSSSSSSSLLWLFLFLLLERAIELDAAVYIVGDEDGWTTGYNYLSWSMKYNFSVGDTLVFNYVKGQHNTWEVTEGAYRSCNMSTGVLKQHRSGTDQIALSEERGYWFVCSIEGHCPGGMKLGVQVTANHDAPSPEAPPSDNGGGQAPPPDAGAATSVAPAAIFIAWFLHFYLSFASA
ncbi:hypothetical protein AMTRI_Chr10g231760 [Amborella trichopoda]|uniref:Phytocyanin domain-containing protein n=1 Tax=Amborella trichopoda TaxID=13333 RepID=W1P7D5_AMBTC|nr:mavicyanin [Amborella trichopoda]ERN05787.1 hypothetical protein AMTR_s00006p00255320 [Amborella trichopoda]|eukprot:XP_006844112.1 mavicyanin [Amborella trichopoda]